MRKTALFYLSVFFLFSIFYLILFHTPLFSSQKVLFYRGVAHLAVVSIISLCMGVVLVRTIKLVRMETLVAAIIMSASIHLALFVVFPVTFDRSVTMFLLNALSVSSMKKEKLENVFISEYVKKQDAVGRRIREQAVTGFVQSYTSEVQLSSKGKRFLKISKIIKWLYGIK